MKLITKIFSALAFIAISSQVHAVTVFSDNFNGENGGVGQTNFNTFSQWSVTGGTVDLIGNGFFDFIPGNGLYVDMDGSTNNAGILESIELSLTSGNYVLSYQLAGNRRGGDDTVDVNTGFASASHTLASGVGFTTFFLPFTVLSDTTGTITFEGLGGNNVGLLLDNVNLEKQDGSPVPDTGATVSLLGMALTGIMAAARRFRKK